MFWGQALIEFRRTNKARSWPNFRAWHLKTDSKSALATSLVGSRSPPLTTSFGISAFDMSMGTHPPTLPMSSRMHHFPNRPPDHRIAHTYQSFHLRAPCPSSAHFAPLLVPTASPVEMACSADRSGQTPTLTRTPNYLPPRLDWCFGLGTYVTQAFLDAGATVIGTSRKILRSRFNNPNFIALPAEISTREGAKALVDQIVTRCGKLDMLAHTVGGFAGGQSIAETDDVTFQRMFDLNLNCVFHILRATVPLLRQTGHGAYYRHWQPRGA